MSSVPDGQGPDLDITALGNRHTERERFAHAPWAKHILL